MATTSLSELIDKTSSVLSPINGTLYNDFSQVGPDPGTATSLPNVSNLINQAIVDGVIGLTGTQCVNVNSYKIGGFSTSVFPDGSSLHIASWDSTGATGYENYSSLALEGVYTLEIEAFEKTGSTVSSIEKKIIKNVVNFTTNS